MEQLLNVIDAYRQGEVDFETLHRTADACGVGPHEMNDLVALVMSEATGAAS